MVTNLLKKQKILKNLINRKRLSKANFYKEKIGKNIANIDYICCIPVNGLSSDFIQNIRNLFSTYGYTVSQYTTKSFLHKLRQNNITIIKEDLSLFYIGQMLVITISLNLNKDNKILNKFQKENEIKFLRFLHASLHNIPFASLLYVNCVQSNYFVVSNKVSDNILKILTVFSNKNIHFSSLSSIANFISLLLLKVIFLLSLLTYMKNNKNIEKK